MQGGGLLSLSAFAGVTAALLSVYAADRGIEDATLAGSGLYAGFDLLSSVSGGSWFAASLIYSANGFLPMVEGMARTPGLAGSLFYAGWMQKWIEVGQPSHKWGGFVEDMAKALNLSRFYETFAEFQYVQNHGDHWSDFVGVVLGISNISKDVQLGSPVAPWAEGKTWLVDHSMVVASPKDLATLHRQLGVSVQYHLEGSLGVALPEYLPASFSIKLGAGPDEPAPFPYISPNASALLGSLEYSKSAFFQGTDQVTSQPMDPSFPAMTGPVGHFSVLDACTATSAAFGGSCLSSSFGFLNDFVDAHFTPWVSSAGAGKAFSDAASLVHGLDEGVNRGRAGLERLAQAQVRGVIDGGYTDNTAIAHAIASGAEEVMAFLHNKTDLDSLLNLFQGGQSKKSEGAGVDVLFFQIFAEGLEEARTQLGALARLEVAPAAKGGQSFLQGMSVGTLQVTTADNVWFGIPAGRKVSIRVLVFDSPLNMGFFADFRNYDQLVQEIVSCLTSSKSAEVVKSQLLTYLLQ